MLASYLLTLTTPTQVVSTPCVTHIGSVLAVQAVLIGVLTLYTLLISVNVIKIVTVTTREHNERT
jgi:hypothetical protein